MTTAPTAILESMKLVENNGETTQLGGVTRRGFMPGHSGNPKGRPKGIASTVRKACGGDPETLIQTLLAIARGESTNGKPARAADQIRAAELVLAYGWGKPAAFVPIDSADPLELDKVTAEIRAISEELRARDAKV